MEYLYRRDRSQWGRGPFPRFSVAYIPHSQEGKAKGEVHGAKLHSYYDCFYYYNYYDAVTMDSKGYHNGVLLRER